MATFTKKFNLANSLCQHNSDGDLFYVRGYFDQRTNTFVSACGHWGIKFKKPKQFANGELVLLIVFKQTYFYEILPNGFIREIMFKDGGVYIHIRKASFLERCFSKRLKTPFMGIEPPQNENEGHVALDPLTGTYIEPGDLFFLQDGNINLAVFI